MNKYYVVGGIGAVLVVGYMVVKSGGGSGNSSNERTGDLTYVGPGVPAVTTTPSGLTDAGITDMITSGMETQLAALNSQYKLAMSDQLTQSVLDMYSTIAPAVNVSRGFTQNFTAGVDYTSSGAVVSFSGGIAPTAPQQDLVDQIAHLTDENTDSNNRINLLSDQVTTLSSQNASLSSGKTLAEQNEAAANQRALSAENKISALRNYINSALAYVSKISQSGITSQKSASGTSKEMVATGTSGALQNLQAALGLF